MVSILEMSNKEAREFLLEASSYANFELPAYFDFQKVLSKVDTYLSDKELKSCQSTYITSNKKTKQFQPKDFEGVNYKFLNNKDGRYSYRPFQLIHPALYVSLVHAITEECNWNKITRRFKQLHANPKIVCCSMPGRSSDEQEDKKNTILNWWNSVEQKSIEQALYFDYVIHTDITNCYGNIYTHSIAWAIEGKDVTKNDRSHNLLGNLIDSKISDMSYGQTNGIPQGSVLMDLIAEMVLGYTDHLLTEKLVALNEYHIIRYRDDYRVFANSPIIAEEVMKHITECLSDIGLSLGASKTFPSSDLVRSAIKPDKIYWNSQVNYRKSFQKHLLLINELSHAYPNSGQLYVGLSKFLKRISNFKRDFNDTRALISIVVDIAYRNPRIYPVSAAIISNLIKQLDESEQIEIIEAVRNKFDRLPNTGHIFLWLQRVLIKIKRNTEFSEPLCELVNNSQVQIWNSDWIHGKLKKIISDTPIINEKTIEGLDNIITVLEVESSDYEVQQSKEDGYVDVFKLDNVDGLDSLSEEKLMEYVIKGFQAMMNGSEKNIK